MTANGHLHAYTRIHVVLGPSNLGHGECTPGHGDGWLLATATRLSSAVRRACIRVLAVGTLRGKRCLADD